MSLSIGIGLGMGRSGGTSTPAAQLTALVASLGGYIFVPGQQTYGDMTAAYPQTALPTDGSIGYIGDLGNQTVAENFIKYSTFAGATTGTPGSKGGDWLGDTSKNGLSMSILAADTESITVRVSGTATATSFFSFLQSPTNVTQVTPGQLWTSAVNVSLVAGSFVADKFHLLVNEVNSVGVFLANSYSTVNPTSTDATYTHTRRLSNASCAYVYLGFRYSYTSGEVIDFTIRISRPQLNRGNPTAYVPTYGTAISRPVFAEASQSTTANMPILRDVSGVKWAEYDGVNDHLITGITSPSSGYMCVVANQTKALGSSNCLIGCYKTATNIPGIAIYVENNGKVKAIKANSAGSSASAESSVITPGVPFIADMSFSTANIKVRNNGANEAVTSSTVDPMGTGVLLIGARNTVSSGVVSADQLFQGNIAAVVIIPNVTLPEATEQQIRQLMGQIYGISTL